MPTKTFSLQRPERVANEALEQYIGKFPIDVRVVAKTFGCRVVTSKLDNEVSGLLIRDGTSILIAVNESESETRRRFTIAHEIGHLLLHRGRPLLVDADVRINKRTPTNGFATANEETEANRFAAALLMPSAEIERVVRTMKLTNHHVGAEALKKLRLHFGVSESAMQFRLMNLGLFLPH